MIDVPVRVKDALRDGSMHKNYRFDVYETVEVEDYQTVYTTNSTGVTYVTDQDFGLNGPLCIVVYDESFNGNVTFTRPNAGGAFVVWIEPVTPAEPMRRIWVDGGEIPTNTTVDFNGTLEAGYSIDLQWMYGTHEEESLLFSIDNNNLVSESVKFDERMCTGNQLKFGLCEGSSLEFQYFDHPNITGKYLQAFVDVEYVDENNETAWHTIPMGFFDVDQCPMQFSTGIRKVTAYNKLKSAYLDEKANALIADAFSEMSAGNTITFYDIRRLLLADYEIEYKGEAISPHSVSGWWSGPNRKCGSASTKYKAKYGISSPLNWFMYANFKPVSPTTALPSLYPFCSSREMEIDLDANKAYTIDFRVDLEEYEQYIYNRIKEIITMSTTTSGQTFVNNMMSTYSYTNTDGETITYKGWPDFFGITLIKSDNTEERYSGIAYRNNVSNVKGTLKELSLLTITDCTKIKINIPMDITLFDTNNADLDGEYTTYFFFTQEPYRREYWYYINSEWGRSLPQTYCDLYPNNELVTYNSFLTLVKAYDMDLTPADLISVDPFSLADITLRDALSAVYELSACYGKLDRNTNMFAPVELNNSRLLPADTLYPNDALYPNGDSLRSDASMYQKLWTDSQGVQTFRYLIITYKTIENNQEVEKTLQRTVNADGTTDYYMSNNWLFKNLIWTESDVGDYADAMVLKMQNVSWFPFEMWCAGLPYIETGDELEITNSEGTYTSYVLQRQLNGIQNLQDTFIDGELDIF